MINRSFMLDRTDEIRITAGAVSIPANFIENENALILASGDLEAMVLYSDTEAFAGVDAQRVPSIGPGVYPKTRYTQTIYFALEIHTKGRGRVILNRIVREGGIDCFKIAQRIKNRIGIDYDLRDDFSGRSYFASATFILLTATLLGLIFGG